MFRNGAALLLITSLGAGCASASPAGQGAAAPSTSAAAMPAAAGSAKSVEGAVFCDLICEQARVVKRADDLPDYHQRATENANRVLATMQQDLLACYKQRVATNPAAHGFITVDIVIGPDGRVLKVETTGGAVLGQATMGCIVHRIERGQFDPPHGGGTLRIQVPFSLRRVAAGEEA